MTAQPSQPGSAETTEALVATLRQFAEVGASLDLPTPKRTALEVAARLAEAEAQRDEAQMYDDELYKAGWSDPAVPTGQQRARAERAEAKALALAGRVDELRAEANSQRLRAIEAERRVATLEAERDGFRNEAEEQQGRWLEALDRIDAMSPVVAAARYAREFLKATMELPDEVGGGYPHAVTLLTESLARLDSLAAQGSGEATETAG